MENDINEVNKFRYPNSRDLLKQFTPPCYSQIETASLPTKDSREIELNLGLSLGGKFGVDKNKTKITRSFSIAGDVQASMIAYSRLLRTSSLPAETDDTCRKRKEIQSLRRMEAKKKRSEKQRSCRSNKDRTSLDRSSEEDTRGEAEHLAVGAVGENGSGNLYPFFTGSHSLKGFGATHGLPNGSFTLPENIALSRKNIGNALPLVSSQGSIGSQQSSNSGGSEGLSYSTEARSPASVQSLPELKSTVDPMILKSGKSASKSDECGKKEISSEKAREDCMNVMEDMPCVSTRGAGPNGRRIEGFLYKYKKGEEVKIVCVCHGSFLTPAEFVRHAGGGDVDHPLRHIVVSPSSSIF